MCTLVAGRAVSQPSLQPVLEGDQKSYTACSTRIDTLPSTWSLHAHLSGIILQASMPCDQGPGLAAAAASPVPAGGGDASTLAPPCPLSTFLNLAAGPGMWEGPEELEHLPSALADAPLLPDTWETESSGPTAGSRSKGFTARNLAW